MRESSTYQGILEEGREIGREIGRIQGELESLRTALIAVLERKFASVSPTLEKRIKESTEIEKLRAGIVTAATASTLDEFEREFSH